MISRQTSMEVLKAVAKGTWDRLPSILSIIPATAIAGKLLEQIKQIADEAIAAGKNSEEIKVAVENLIENAESKEEFLHELKEEIKKNRDEKNPKYINCVLFLVKEGDKLTVAELESLKDVLVGDFTSGDEKFDAFVTAFVDDYFGGDVDSCDCPYELEAEYISFNFDEYCDHEYDEKDLEEIRDMLNKLVGRQVFVDFEGFGTDDSVEGYY